MEGGTTRDVNFNSQQDAGREQKSRYQPPPLPAYDERSPDVPPKLPLMAANSEAAAANGNIGGGGHGSPDQYYRGYQQKTPTSAKKYSNVSLNGSSPSSLRQPNTTLRSNGNGTTPKYPSIPTSDGCPKPTNNLRSASAPMADNKMGTPLKGTTRSSQPQQSVRDLLKKFDNPADAQTQLKPTPPRFTKSSTLGRPDYMKSRMATQDEPSSSSPRPGVATRTTNTDRVLSPAGSRTPRGKFSAEDHHSNTTLSRPARTEKNQPTATAGTHASQSMISLQLPRPSPSTSKSFANLTSPKEEGSTRPLLFGELTPSGSGIPTLGSGIARKRPTSESSLYPVPPPATNHANADATLSSEFPSSSASHLSAVGRAETRPAAGHRRAHSDISARKPGTLHGAYEAPAPFLETPAQDISPTLQRDSTKKATSQSRLPLSSNRLSNRSDTPSQASSSRANSSMGGHGPKRNSSSTNVNVLRKPEQPWSPAGRSTTPTTRAPSRIAISPGKQSTKNASLKAYISSTEPQLSPPLRSSRPRQPVSSASTASSRNRVVEQSNVPLDRPPAAGRHTSRSRQALDTGPVDFAARRAQIHQNYSKTIHEKEQTNIRRAEARRVAAEREEEARLANETAASLAAEGGPWHHVRSPGSEPDMHEEANEPLSPTSPRSLTILIPPTPKRSEFGVASPGLDMPGSFPATRDSLLLDVSPHSAISDNTVTTQFDGEPQTEAPRPSTHLVPPRSTTDAFTGRHIPIRESSFSSSCHTEEQDDIENDKESIRIGLAQTPVEDTEPFIDQQMTSSAPSPTISQQVSDESCDEDEQPVFSAMPSAAGSNWPSDGRLMGHDIPAPPPRNTHPDPDRQVLSRQEAEDRDESEGDYYRSHLNDVVEKIINDAELTPRKSNSSPKVSHERSTSYGGGGTAPLMELSYLNTTAMAVSPIPLVSTTTFVDSPVTDMGYDDTDGGNDPLRARASENEARQPYAGELEIRSRPDRSSHLSNWTDYSITSTTNGNSSQYGDDYDPYNDSYDRRPTPPPKARPASPKPEVPPKPASYSPSQLSPRPSISSHSSSPALSGSQNFGMIMATKSPYRASASPLPPLPPWPAHTPPPPPESHSQPIIEGDEASYLEGNRSPQPLNVTKPRPPIPMAAHSAGDVRRPSGESAATVQHSNASARSSAQISVDGDYLLGSQESTPRAQQQPETEEEIAAAEKTRKRLFTRRMLIKELIDTESVYLKDMNVVEEIYKGTADACPRIELADTKAIFRNTDQVIAFSTKFLDDLKTAVASVYVTRPSKIRQSKTTMTSNGTQDRLSIAATLLDETDDQKDRKTFVGANFGSNINGMTAVYSEYLRNSENASVRLANLQLDPTVQVWLGECDTVAKDLTQAWSLDALLVKPVQRITRYQLMLSQILEHTPEDHPDCHALQQTVRDLAAMLKQIDEMKTRVSMVNRMVGRKRTSSDVRTGLAKAFGRRGDRLALNPTSHDDEEYLKLHDKFNEDYMQLQIVLRDIEFYTRHVPEYVKGFLNFLSSMELVMRLQASSYPEIESKWVKFNVSMHEIGGHVLDDHVGFIFDRLIDIS